MTAILFLGGWLPPFAVAPFTWIPGLVWFLLKLFFVFFMFAHGESGRAALSL